jgi:hypothetical protein
MLHAVNATAAVAAAAADLELGAISLRTEHPPF